MRDLPAYKPMTGDDINKRSAGDRDTFMAWKAFDAEGKKNWDALNAWADQHPHRDIAIDILAINREPATTNDDELRIAYDTIELLVQLIGDPVLAEFLGYPLIAEFLGYPIND